jgi:hypothetical protein
MISWQHFDETSYSGAFVQALKVNNLVYKVTFQIFFIFLAYVVGRISFPSVNNIHFAGLFASFLMALTTATAEFSWQFLLKPFLRIVRILFVQVVR